MITLWRQCSLILTDIYISVTRLQYKMLEMSLTALISHASSGLELSNITLEMSGFSKYWTRNIRYYGLSDLGQLIYVASRARLWPSDALSYVKLKRLQKFESPCTYLSLWQNGTLETKHETGVNKIIIQPPVCIDVCVKIRWTVFV